MQVLPGWGVGTFVFWTIDFSVCIHRYKQVNLTGFYADCFYSVAHSCFLYALSIAYSFDYSKWPSTSQELTIPNLSKPIWCCKYCFFCNFSPVFVVGFLILLLLRAKSYGISYTNWLEMIYVEFLLDWAAHHFRYLLIGKLGGLSARCYISENRIRRKQTPLVDLFLALGVHTMVSKCTHTSKFIIIKYPQRNFTIQSSWTI